MRKKIFFLPSIFLVIFFIIEGSYAQTVQDSQKEEVKKQEPPVVTRGKIIEIDKDGSYIIIKDNQNKVKFFTTKEFIDNAYFEVNDEVEFIGENTGQGLKLIDYNYIFEENEDTRIFPSDNSTGGLLINNTSNENGLSNEQ